MPLSQEHRNQFDVICDMSAVIGSSAPNEDERISQWRLVPGGGHQVSGQSPILLWVFRGMKDPLCALIWADLFSQLSPTPLSNAVESPFDKRQYTLQGQDTGRKPRLKQGTILVEQPHCPWTGDGSLPRGWRVTERGGMIYCEDIALLRVHQL
ncbi:hypothetical protein EYF80_021536 [Liparis tanakae]|uniref:Uncharacterized protein n=1 Tax=Liparis tanakae TaxID=230148 RepID=A0A4Z2HT93_9TELE|nr:hypothetical protein EYF80_021536 [Liparis tanakae]